MRRVLKFTGFLFLLLLVYQFVVIYLEDSHVVEYKITSDGLEFNIKEEYRKNSYLSGYFINVKNGNNDFVFYLDNKYNKQKKVVKDIKYLKKDDYFCVYPVPMKEDLNIDILCSKDNKLYDAQYVINEGVDLSSLVNNLEKYSLYKSSNKTTSYTNTLFYKNNLAPKEIVVMYKYKNMFVYNKENDKVNNIELFDSDLYDNKLSAYTEGYYFTPVKNGADIGSYIIVNMVDGKKREIYLDDHMSYNSYNLGVVDNKLYVFDLTNKVEYEFRTDSSYKVVGTVKSGFKAYVNGKWEKVSVTEFTDKNIKFSTNLDINKKYDQIYDAKSFYYIIRDKKVYKIYKNDLNVEIYLGTITNNNDIFANNDKLYYIDNGYLYKFDKYGNKKIAYDNELKYNKENMVYAFINNKS